MEAMSFIYNGVACEKYNVMLCSFESKFTENINDGLEIDFIEDKIKRNPVPYFYGCEFNGKLSFELTICNKDGAELDIYDKSAISQWLLCRNGYKPLQIADKNGEIYNYNAIITNSENIFIAGKTYGKKFTVICDSPFAWSKDITKKYSITKANQQILFLNNSDIDDYIYPAITFTLTGENRNLSIINQSDNNRQTAFLGLNKGETVKADSKTGIITSDSTNKRFSNFNDNFLRLVRGYNKLLINGTCELEITAKFCKMTGII